jgi:hypothetical protein
MLTAENRLSLQQDYFLLPVIEGIARTLNPGHGVSLIEKFEIAVAPPDPGWIVFGDSELGFAVNTHGDRLTKSGLGSRLLLVSDARNIAQNIESFVSIHLKPNLIAQCPSSWVCYRVDISSCEVSFALSASMSTITNPNVSYKRIHDRLVRVPIYGELSWDGVICVGGSRVISDLVFYLPAQNVSAKISLSGEELIKMEPVELNESINKLPREVDVESQKDSVLIQVNLGEIELSLRELAALRNGTCIELSARLPLECVLRVGITTLAKGELASHEDKMVLTIREVL